MQTLSLCLECLEEPSSAAGRYVRCVALKGRQPGLGIDTEGGIAWCTTIPLACELWVSADDQLILYRRPLAPPVRVERAGRSVQAPFEKPVVLLDEDVFRVADKIYRVHVHGATSTVAKPTPLTSSALGRLAATVAIGVAAFGCNKKGVEVRDMPPSPPPEMPGDAQSEISEAVLAVEPEAGAAAPPDAAETGKPDSGKPDAAAKAKPKAIEVRDRPPEPPVPE